jgi:hypothetical protein
MSPARWLHHGPPPIQSTAFDRCQGGPGAAHTPQFTAELIGRGETLMNVSEYYGDDSQWPPDRHPCPAEGIQICASQNDLFTLDGEGNVYPYNFSAKT